jgi:ribosomal protein S21
MTNYVIEVREGNVEGALARLKRKLAANGTFADLRRHEHYMKPGEVRRLKSRKARAKARKTKCRRDQGDPR